MAQYMPEEGYQIALERIEKAKKIGATELDLSGLNLSTLPAEIWQLSMLEKLRLGESDYPNWEKNHLSVLPIEIGKLVNLTSLDLSGNELRSLSVKIGKLINLVSLKLNGNRQLKFLPAEMGQLPNLTSLDLSYTCYESIPAGVGQLLHLTSLKLSGNSLTSLPTEILQLVNLTSLEMIFNQIAFLPAEIRQLTNLTSLNLYQNKLTTLPAEMGQLTNLTSLTLSNNSITSLPAEIGQLVNLTSLDIGANDFGVLPAMIGKLVNLTSLIIRGIRLTNLPAEIGKLINLTSLQLQDNKLDSLPAEIGQLVNLTSLDLSNNRLETLPTGIQDLKKLKELNLKKNSLPIPPEILEKTKEPQVILDYCFSRLKKSFNECKVLVVGQGSVGKTSLIMNLVKGEFNPTENKTEGIAITNWHLAGFDLQDESKPTKISLNMWDFGGQEIMHATHQFFLTKRSLYILVLDSRLTQEENRVEYWLKMIQSFGGDSPVLVVGNKTDQHPLDIDRSGLQKKYSNIVGIFETSAATGKGMEGLRSAIAEQIHNLPHVRDLLPESWFMVKKQLEELGQDKNFINHDEFLSLCSKNEVGEESSQRTLIGFMHDLGVILHFQDDPRLEALGILNPQWVTNGVYKILNAHALFQNKGVLRVNLLNEILDLPEYPRDKRLFIVDMMKKFELCYDIVADKTFLVPDLLPKDEPFTDEWDNALAFQYHYTVLPSSVITRFIVRMNEFIHKTVWRSGVVLKSGENTALVKADMEDRKVYILVSGDDHKRHDFLTKIRGQFDSIHKTITKLEVKEMVPVPGHPEAEPVDYDLLLQMEHNNVPSHAVLSGGKMIVVNVREMLSGVARQEDRQRGGVEIHIHGNVEGSNIIAGDENQVGRKK